MPTPPTQPRLNIEISVIDLLKDIQSFDARIVAIKPKDITPEESKERLDLILALLTKWETLNKHAHGQRIDCSTIPINFIAPDQLGVLFMSYLQFRMELLSEAAAMLTLIHKLKSTPPSDPSPRTPPPYAG